MPGWLEGGASPDDDRTIKAYLSASTGGLDAQWRYMVISHRQL